MASEPKTTLALNDVEAFKVASVPGELLVRRTVAKDRVVNEN